MAEYQIAMQVERDKSKASHKNEVIKVKLSQEKEFPKYF